MEHIEQVFNEQGCPLDMSRVEFLTDKGSEFIVYKYLDMVIKLYKKNYKLSHLSLEEIKILKSIATQRILLPRGVLLNQDGELAGYSMPYIDGERNILYDSASNLLDELEIIKQDLNLLCNNYIILRDINLANTIYNGQMYLIDPGNYLINDLQQISVEDVNSLTLEEKQELLMNWNCHKIKTLLDMLLFSNKKNIDPFQFRQIIQFFMKERESMNLKNELDIFKLFLNPDLIIDEAIDKFMKEYIKDNPEERTLFFSLYRK